MTQVSISASRDYTVTIGKGLLPQIGQIVTGAVNPQKACIVSDSHVWPLYGACVTKSLEAASMKVCHYIFPAGEKSKNGQVYLDLMRFLAEEALSRNDCIIALGGGVTGDLAGFAAATYLRGISYIQVPTTVLAMVDSSVGGKTAIDLPAGKNLCGAFWQPAAVVCDIDTLNTLPEEDFRDGCAEVIKYGILFDPDLFAHLEEMGLAFDSEEVITRCVTWKRDVVAADEFDKGARQMLNLGHTIGHAIEKCSQYAISHGNAVSIGMAVVCRAAGCKDTTRILTLLRQFGLPVTTSHSAKELCSSAISDKKRSGDTIHLIVPKAIGQCEIQHTPIDDLKTFIEEGI